MRIRVLHTTDYRPPESPRISVRYSKGLECTVKRTWGEALVEAGVAVEVEAHHREKQPEG
jgi:hypothetical protein